jgi:hypothetical protein
VLEEIEQAGAGVDGLTGMTNSGVTHRGVTHRGVILTILGWLALLTWGALVST